MERANSIADIKATPFFSQFTDEQIRNQITANAKQLRWMQIKAESTGKKYGGYTANQLKELAEHYEKIAKS